MLPTVIPAAAGDLFKLRWRDQRGVMTPITRAAYARRQKGHKGRAKLGEQKRAIRQVWKKTDLSIPTLACSAHTVTREYPIGSWPEPETCPTANGLPR
jgi:hypothetical protein